MAKMKSLRTGTIPDFSPVMMSEKHGCKPSSEGKITSLLSPVGVSCVSYLHHFLDRIQGIVASMSRVPTFRRRFRNLVKVLYVEALQAGAARNHIGEILNPRLNVDSLIKVGGADKEGRGDSVIAVSGEEEKHDKNADIV